MGQVTITLLVVAGALVMLTGFQRSLVYFPEKAGETELLLQAQVSGLEPWRDGGGDLIGWRSAARQCKHRVVVFHGNAGYALHRFYFAQGFAALDEGWCVYLFEYPGYGARQGTPSEANIKSSARDALQQLLEEATTPVFLVGESLGSGVAAYLAGQFPRKIAGLLLITPFTSLVDVGAYHYSWLPVRYLLQERYDSTEALSNYRGPIAFLVAERDEIVPAELGIKLYNNYGGPKLLRVESGAGHNSLPLYPGAAWWKEMSAFLLTSTRTFQDQP